MNRQQRRANAKQGKAGKQARGSAGSALDALFGLALQHHQSGDLARAEQIYQNILAADPHHTGALNHLGILAFQSGAGDAALGFLKKAVARDSANPIAHFNLGLVYAALGRDREAITHNRKAVALKPEYADAHTNLGGLLLRGGSAGEALSHFRHVMALAPSPRAHENLATALLANGNPAEALTIAMRGFEIGATPELRDIFLRAVSALPSLVGIDDDACRRFLLRALNESWCRPANLLSPALSLLPRDPALLRRDELFLALLRATPIADLGLEERLTGLRRELLDAALTDAIPPDEDLAFACALAQQCFLNEYAFASTAHEHSQIEELTHRLGRALATDETVSSFRLAARACYRPLHDLPDADRVASQSWPPPLREVMVQQIEDPRREHQLRESIEVLTAIDDTVSLKVQDQYEQNAYPRWARAATTATPASFDRYVLSRLPAATPYRRLGEKPVDLLVAGCGTGRQVIERLMRCTARATAIDLSRSSLAYAIRKTEELGVTGVRYKQADILQLGPNLGPFDVIECSGVLHHLRDPFAGWRVLLSLLRPGGLMQIALYSTAARANIRAARDYISSSGYDGTPDGIRSFRQAIIALPVDDPRRAITANADFFTISECRDLVFHVQESTFTLPQIAEFIRGSGMVFVGFETDAGVAYLRRFPQDPAATNLDNWDRFEADHPATFASMYQFWVQKPG